MESSEVDGRGLVVSGGQAAPLLEFVDAPLDGVPLVVGLAIEGRRAAPEAAQPPTVRGLVGWLRDHRPDPASSQVAADRSGGVRLIGQDGVRRCPGPAGRPGYWQPGHDLGECGCITGLAWGDDERERAAAAVRGEVDLRGQSAAGASEGMVGRLAGRGPF